PSHDDLRLVCIFNSLTGDAGSRLILFRVNLNLSAPSPDQWASGINKGCVMNNFRRFAATVVVVSFATGASISTASANPFESMFGQHRPTVQAPGYAPSDDGAAVRGDLKRRIV